MKKGFTSVRYQIAIVLIVMGAGPHALAQDNSAGEPEDSVSATADFSNNSRLEDKKAEANLKADIAEAKKREALAGAETAKAGAGESKGLDGTVTLNDGAGYFSEILAYESVSNVAVHIAEAVVTSIDGENRRIVITDQLDIAAISALWNLVVKQIEVIGRQMTYTARKFEDPTEETAAEEQLELTSAAAVSTGISSIADILSYFREDSSLTKFNVNLSNRALMAEVAAAIQKRKPGSKIVMPTFSFGEQGIIVSSLRELLELRNTLQDRLEAINKVNSDKLTPLKKLIASRNKKIAEKAALMKKKPVDSDAVATKQKEIDDANQKIQILEKSGEIQYVKIAEKEIPKAIKSYDNLTEMLTTSKKDGEKAPIERLSEIDALRADPNALFLYLNIVGQGGEVQITKSIWTGGRISYIGGNTSVFFLTDKYGNLWASGSPSEYHKAWYGQRGGVGKIKSDIVAQEIEVKSD